jgi:hypothetical protein
MAENDISSVGSRIDARPSAMASFNGLFQREFISPQTPWACLGRVRHFRFHRLV